MVTDLQGDQLPQWIESARAATGLPSHSRFAQHLERATLTPSSPDSPNRGTPVSSRATPPGSRYASARCSAAQDSSSSASASCSPNDHVSRPDPTVRHRHRSCGASRRGSDSPGRAALARSRRPRSRQGRPHCLHRYLERSARHPARRAERDVSPKTRSTRRTDHPLPKSTPGPARTVPGRG